MWITGVNMAWRQTKWKTWKTYLGTNKQVFDAKLYVIGEAIYITLKG